MLTEPLVDLAAFLLNHEKFEPALHYAILASQVVVPSINVAEAYAQNEGPYDLAALALCCLNRVGDAFHHGQRAVELNGHDARLKEKLAIYRQMDTLAPVEA